MMRRGKPCSVCQHPKLEAIDADERSYPKVAKAFGLSPATVQRHRIHRREEKVAAMKAAERPSDPPPPLSIAAMLEALEAGLSRMIQKLGQVEVEDIPRYLATMASMRKQIESLKQETQITEEQIVKAPAFRSLLDRFVEALRPYPEAARAMLAALEAA